MAVNYETLMNAKNEMVRTAEPDPIGSGLRRYDFWNVTMNIPFAQTDCEAKGLGYTWNGTHCFFPCPPAYSIMDGNIYKCEQRTLITDVVDYYAVLSSALSSCAQKNAAIGSLVANGTDPSTVPWPADCPYPYSPEDAPYVPPVPEGYTRPDPTGVDGTPATRITFLSDELDAIPKKMEYGIERDSPLVALLRSNPTYVDSHPEYLNEMTKLVPTFTWSVKFTQSDFDKLDKQWQCQFCDNPNLIYDNPSVIASLRKVIPELEIIRGAPEPMPTKFQNCPADIVKKQCDEWNDIVRKQVGGDDRPCNFKTVKGTGCQSSCEPISRDGCPPKDQESNFWGDFAGVWTDFGGGVAGVVNGVVDAIEGTGNALAWLYENAEYIAIGGVVLYVVFSLDSGEGGGGTVIVSAPAPASK